MPIGIAPAAIRRGTTVRGFVWQKCVVGAGGSRGNAGEVDVVLDREGNSIEREIVAKLAKRTQRFGAGDRFFFGNEMNPNGALTVLANAPPRFANHLRGREAAIAVGSAEAGEIEFHAASGLRNIRLCPAATCTPGLQRISTTVLPCGAETAISIFIDSRTISRWPCET